MVKVKGNNKVMQHPDVIQLENKLKDVWAERDNEKARELLKNELDVDDDLAPVLFWCKKCGKDYYPKRVVKVISRDWNTNGVFRYWRSKHCGVMNTRLISQKTKDKFFIKSPSVCRDRRINAMDMLQPQETGYNMLYGHKGNV